MYRVGSLFGGSRKTLLTAQDYHKEAHDHQKQGNLDRAKASYLQALYLADQAYLINPTKANVSRTFAQINQDYGSLLEILGDYDYAEKVYQQAQKYGQKACELEPNHNKNKDLLKEIKLKHEQFLQSKRESTKADNPETDQTDRADTAPHIPPGLVQAAFFAQIRRGVHSNQEISALINSLFEEVLSRLAYLKVPNKPSSFLVYAHNNPFFGEARAEDAKYFIEKLSSIGVTLYSDQTPMGPTYLSLPETLKDDGRLEDILTSQLSLLPAKLKDDVSPVDKVIVCCSEVLANYLTWPHYPAFYQALRDAYQQDVKQQSTVAIRYVIRQFSEKKPYCSGFHHVLTEIAFLQIRAEVRPEKHGIIPVSLTRNSSKLCLADFIPTTTVRIEDINRLQNQEIYANQARHGVLLKLIERLLISSNEAKTFLDKFWSRYSKLTARLKEIPDALTLTEYDSFVVGIYKDLDMAVIGQLPLTLRESQATQKQTLEAAAEPLAILGKNLKQFKQAYQKNLRGTGELDVLSMYVPVQGIKKGPQGEELVDLEQELERFFASEASVFLLQGGAGSGKSTFNRHLALKKLTDYQRLSQTIDDPLLVFFIELRSIDNPNKQVIEQFLQSKGFAAEQIEALRTHAHQRCIFILDGYDEIKERNRDFYGLNKLEEWKKAKFVITSRPEYLDSNYQPYFRPKAAPQALWEAQMAPFSTEQRIRYISHYVEQTKPLWSVEQYERAFNQLTPLAKELERPVVLRMLLQILPELEGDPQQAKNLTLSAVYEQYFQHWWANWQTRLWRIPLTDDEEKAKQVLAEREGGFIPQGFTYIENCALALTKSRLTIAQDNQNFKKRYADVYKAFFEEGAKTRLLRFNAPFQIKQKQYFTFSHKSMQEYLVARAICAPKFEEITPHPTDELNQLSLVNELVILDFLVEQVKAQPSFKAYLHAWIEMSKQVNAPVAVGAANAITVLVRAGIQFNEADLRNICIPTADLSFGVFDSSQLSGANLSGTSLTGIWLRNADLTGARMDGVQFGELPGLRLDKRVNACCYSPSGRYLVVAADEKLALYEVKTLTHVRTFEGHTGWVTSVAFSNDEQTIASGNEDNTVRLWSIAEKNPLHTFKGHTHSVASVAFSSDGQMLVSGSDDHTIRLWSVYKRKPLYSFEGHTGPVTSVAFSVDGQTLASGSDDYTIRLWSVDRENPLHTFKGHTNSVRSVAFSNDGQTLASGSDDHTMRLWSIDEKKPLHSFEGHTNSVRSVTFSSDGQALASGSDDHTVRLWSVDEKKPLQLFEGHTDSVRSVTFSGNGQILASGSRDQMVRLWSIDEKKLLHSFEGHTDSVRSVAFSTDGKTLASGGNDKSVRLWLIDEKKTRHKFEGHTNWVTSVVFSSDGQTLASGSWDNTVRLWSVAEKKPLCLFEGHTSQVTSVSISGDGKTLASGSWDYTVRLWSVAKRKLLHTFERHTDWVTSVAFSTDGKTLASGSYDQTVRLWSAAEKKPLYMFKGHTNWVTSVAFSTDGQMLASGSVDKTVRLWSITSGRCLTVIQGFNGSVDSVAWYTSPRGIWLATGSDDKVVRLWKVHRDDKACRVVLHWASAQTTLTVPDVCIQNVIGLSARNTQLLNQRGAKGRPCQSEGQEAQSLQIESAEASALRPSAQINSRFESMHLSLA